MKNIVSSKIPRVLSGKLLDALEAAGLGADYAQKVIDSKTNKLACKIVRCLFGEGSLSTAVQGISFDRFESFREMSRGQASELVNALEYAGFNTEIALRVIKSEGNNLALKITNVIHDWDSEPPTSHELARQIMGKNYLGQEEGLKHLLSEYIPKNWEQPVIHYGKETLLECRDTHILVCVANCEMRWRLWEDLIKKDGSRMQMYWSSSQFGYWLLLRKTPVPGSTSKNLNTQVGLLSIDEAIPSVDELKYAIALCFRVTGKRLFEGVFVRCLDDKSFQNPSYGNLSNWGLRGHHSTCGYPDYDDYEEWNNLGLASYRKYGT